MSFGSFSLSLGDHVTRSVRLLWETNSWRLGKPLGRGEGELMFPTESFRWGRGPRVGEPFGDS
jgi:hypothetical protein